LARNSGGSGRSRDRLPSLHRFPAARARTSEVGHRSGDEKTRTWSRKGGQRGGDRALEDAVAAGGLKVRQPEGLLICQRERRRDSNIVRKRMKG
jgi:hypothetical protein